MSTINRNGCKVNRATFSDSTMQGSVQQMNTWLKTFPHCAPLNVETTVKDYKYYSIDLWYIDFSQPL